MLFNILLILSLSGFTVVASKEIFVSRFHGNISPSCGKTIFTACKIVALATTQAQWNDTVYIDGTDTSRDPYRCSSVTTYPAGIYVNKSLTFARFGKDEVFFECSPAKKIICDGKNAAEKVIIQLQGLTLMNTQVVVQKCSFDVESCIFKNVISFPNATAVIDFESFEEQFSLTINKSSFISNSISCIWVVGSRPKVVAYDTTFINNTVKHWETTRGVPEAVFVVVIPTKDFRSSDAFVTLANTSFVSNTARFGGCLHIQAQFKTNVRRYKDESTVSQHFYVTEQGRSQSSKELISVNVTNGKFLDNFGGVITLSGFGFARIFIAECNFTRNSSPYTGGALLFKDVEELLLEIEDSNFIKNRAKNGGSAAFVIGKSSKTVSIFARNVWFLRNVLQEFDVIEDFPSGGVLTIYMPHSYLKVLLENVLFGHNVVAKGSSTLLSQGYRQNITIVHSSFVGNTQDERSLYEWGILRIEAALLTFFLTETVISENCGKCWSNNTLMIRQPIHFLVSSSYRATINITGLKYKSNKGGGISIQLGTPLDGNNSVFFLQNSRFENNQKFFLGVRATSSSELQMSRVIFRSNTFGGSSRKYLALFFVIVMGEGSHITLQYATFEKNMHDKSRIMLFRLPPDKRDLNAHGCDNPNWIYKNNVTLSNVLFRENDGHLGYATVLRLDNGRNILNDCRFVGNSGSGIGSNLFIGEGSASLKLANTSFQLTQNHPRNKIMRPLTYTFRGFIYIASSGLIELKNTRLSVDQYQDIDSFLIVSASSITHIDNSSIIQCPVGTLRMFSNLSHMRFLENGACPNGFYVTWMCSFTFSCKRCPSGFYIVEPVGQTCRPCPYGGNCTSNIAARPTFWGFPSLSDIGTVSFQQCPVDYCCPYKNISCSYENDQYLSSGCSGNRTGFLCGQCKPGFTETFFSARCRASEDCTDYWFWPVALFYSLAFALFLRWKNPIIRSMKKLLPWGLSTQGTHPCSDAASDGGGYVKVIFYFYQVASLLFVSEGTGIHLAERYLLAPVIGWFNFRPISSDQGLVCPVRGLTVVSKMFLQASQVIAVLFGLVMIFMVHGAVRKLQNVSPTFPSTTQYLAATIECLLLGYSRMSSTSLKALNCVPIQSTSRFFYDGNIQCWQWWQKLCGVFICIFVIPFVYVLYRGSKLLLSKVITTKQFLYACLFPLPFAFRWIVICEETPLNETESDEDSEEQRPILPPSRLINLDPVHDVIYGPFKKSNDRQGPGTVYWESILIGRRLVLISLHTFIVFPFIRMVCLCVACALILAHHMWKKPFKDPRVNHAETGSLTALLVLAVINMAEITFIINGEIPSKQERTCFIVLQVVAVIILGAVPVVCVFVLFVAVLFKLCKLSWVIIRRPFVK